MVLKTLRVRGFKSFPEPVEIHFEKGITAIVGPNGSGKSNIADAIRWVLGEQSAKQLRGAKMDEVIFNGTDSRRPLASCEVTLTLDNADDALGLGADEVAITRRLYRSGESEYLINNTPCRLKDIVEMMRDTGAGREGYSVVGQGRIDEILSNRAEDRRAVFEEAAGIAKYKARKNEAERKLNNTAEHLTRVDDILNELNDRLGPLQQQAEQAREYLVIADELRGLELNAFLLQQEARGQKLQALEQSSQQLQQQRQQLAEDDQQLQQYVQRMELELQQAEQAVAAAREERNRQADAAGKLLAEVRVLQERLSFGSTESQRVAQAAQQAQAAAQTAAQAAQTAQQQQQAQQEAGAQHRQQLQQATQAYEDLSRRLAEDEAQILAARQALMDSINRMSDQKARVSHLQTLADSVERQMQSLLTMAEAADKRYAEASADVEAAQNQLQQGQQASQQAAQEAEEANRQAQAAQTAWQLQQQKRQTTAESIQAAQARLRVLEDLKRDHDGFATAVRSLLRDAATMPALQKRIAGVVAEVIQVPQRYEVAIEMVLGAAMQHIITQDEEDAKALVEHLRRHQYGRVTFLPLNTIRPRGLTPHEQRQLSAPGVLGVASDLIHTPERYKMVIQNLLGRTVVVEELDSGIALARRCEHSLRIVTLAGDMLNVGGSITGGSVNSRVGGLFSRERERQELAGRVETLTQQLQQCVQAVGQTQAAMEQARQEARVAGEELAARQAAVKGMAERLAIMQETQAERRANVEQVAQEKLRLQQTGQDIAQQLAAAQEVIEKARQGNTDDTRAIDQNQDAFTRARAQQVQAQAEVSRLQLLVAEADSQAAGLQREQERQLKAQAAAQQQYQQLQAEQAELERQQKAVQQLLAQTQQQAQADDGDMQQLDAFVAKAEAAREQAFNALRQGERDRQTNIQALADCNQQLLRCETQTERLQAERESAAARIFEAYQLTYADIVPMRQAEFDLTAAQPRINSLRARVRAMGTVNVNAVEECQQLQQRVDELSGQRQDLTTAAQDLTGLIEDLDKKMVVRFREAFAAINEEFGKTFTQLFGGGHAHLALQDDGDWLSSGIEIIARPPGTKLQSLTLLSGGQRALTAIAILFAMLHINPTPFCVLDEIEAALDEANVTQYAEALHAYTAHTQFVVITHRKGTMEAADTLYGVSMQEKGVSTMLSVRLNDAAR